MQAPDVVSGKTNILGIAFLAVWAGVMLGIITYMSPYPPLRRQVGICITGLVLMICDLVWRYRTSSATPVWRLISDVDGGAIAYVPAWFYLPVVSIIAAAYWVGG
jgi:hypothetical protein